ncbi:MAG: hypothetical protein ACYCPQ_01525 [Elusimicrobiota bacterium]
MKKHSWRPLEKDAFAAPAVDIPELKKKEKKKKGGPFWWWSSGASQEVYGALESVQAPGAEIAQSAAVAAAQTAASSAGAISGIASSYLPASLAGKFFAGFLTLASAGAVVTGAALIARGSVRLPGLPNLGGIVDALHYRKASSKSLLYASSAARDLPAGQQASGIGAPAKAADAAAAGGFTGNMASGAPVSGPGAQNPRLDGGSPGGSSAGFSGGFDGNAAGGSQLAGGILAAAGAKKGIVGGAFESNQDAGGTAGTIVPVTRTGSSLANLGRFGTGSSEALGNLRSMRSYVPGMLKGGNASLETPAQLAAEQFNGSGIIGASAPSGISVGGSGVAPLLSTPNTGGGTGAGGGGGANNSCGQDGLVWNGGGCSTPTTPPGANSAPWQSSTSLSNTMLPIASTLIILAAIFAMLSRVPSLSWMMAVAKVMAGAAAAIGAIIVLQGLLTGGAGQQDEGQMMAIAAGITIGGAWAALSGKTSVIIPMIIGAASGLTGMLTGYFTSGSSGGTNPPPSSGAQH